MKWLSDSGQFFIQRTRDMGTTQTAAKTFVEHHEAMQNDLRVSVKEAMDLCKYLYSNKIVYFNVVQ